MQAPKLGDVLWRMHPAFDETFGIRGRKLACLLVAQRQFSRCKVESPAHHHRHPGENAQSRGQMWRQQTSQLENEV
jgi:hypothetical protein